MTQPRGALRVALAAAVFAAALALPAAAIPQETAPAAPGGKPWEEIVKLWKGNLSEDFIRRRIESTGVVYHLSADDIVACKAAGLPEPVIEAMLATEAKTAAAPAAPTAPAAPRSAKGAPQAVAPAAPAPPPPVVTAPVPPPPAPAAASAAPSAIPTPRADVPTAAVEALPVAPPAPPVVPPSPGPAPAPTPNLAAAANRSWEGLARRRQGVSLFRGRWDEGQLAFRAETLSWTDADETKENVSLAGKTIREQFLVCLKGTASHPECFEWGIRTDVGEYRFRDSAWAGSESLKPREIFEFFRAIYPSLVSQEFPADRKK